jgi:formate hydrogenlyase subunit 3/multisubunit Na+/H+ antiporter MnhD subunit
LVVVRLLVLAYSDTAAPLILLVLGTLTILFGEFSAWRAKDFPRMIAFSSIGQLGIVFIAFSIPGPWGLLAGLAVALHHLLIKSALFGLANRWSGSLDGLTGGAKTAPIAAGLFVLFALSLIGVPPLPGFWTKILVLAGLAQQATGLHLTALFAILLITAIEANYLFRFATRLYRKHDSPPQGHGVFDIAPALLIGAAVVAVTVQIDPVGDRLREVARQAADPEIYASAVFPTATTAAALED